MGEALAEMYSTFLTPELEDRRAEPSARAAYYAYAAALVEIDPGQRYPCYTCGIPAPIQWCNTCDVAGNRPLRTWTGFSHYITPMCNTCVADDVTCLICGIKPSAGPTDLDLTMRAANISTKARQRIAHRTCWHCNTTHSGKLVKCARCKEARYCNQDCAQAAWSRHRTWCGKVPPPAAPDGGSHPLLVMPREDNVSVAHQ